MTDFTVTEACTRLDPPISPRTLRALIAVAQLQPTGQRQPQRGRPAATYDSSDLDRLHASWVNGDLTARG